MAKRFTEYGGYLVEVDAKTGLPNNKMLEQLVKRVEEDKTQQPTSTKNVDVNIPDPTVDLKQQIEELKKEIQSLKKSQIVIVGDFDGTNIPVTVNGIRRKIATTAP